ncbi:aminodeoxychorismate lyase [Denitratisoma sp. DHT3]|uniref:endolytic transglycosylase MltG n=1 Tax=Denitratisoma sp. DHT3 TaxID=1981880 RepID=UPI0011986ADD|nr:endolytic transglycosylase MltG [Denitratisoma sp. DHT3]QDX80436.1 aminodeoxychorismate lyase [Denitratisoma sp. DHT3]
MLKRLFLLLVTTGLATVIAIGWFAIRPLELKSTPLEFTIPPGTGLAASSRLMAEAGAGFMPWQFSLLGRLLGKAADIKAGSYEVEQGVTPWQLLAKLTRGDVSQVEVVLLEGKTFRQWRAVLDAHPDLRHDTKGLSEAEILSRLGAREAHPEGLFFPDTYLASKQSSDLDVLRRAFRAMQQRLEDEWARRPAGTPYRTPYEALIMASIVEKETGQAADRPRVAGVFVNRLRAGMLLQTDPTVIYGLGEVFDGDLRKRDLQTDTPYNTYTRPGLPPTPIAMPGLASLRAALSPAGGDHFYFVARGDGSSEFSRTLDEHNRAVVRYQKRKRGAG